MTEVVAIGLHGETVDTDNGGLLAVGCWLLARQHGIKLISFGITIPAGEAEHLIGNEVLAGAVALDDGGHHILWYVLVVGQQLLGVLGQTVAAITERGIIVVVADAGIKTYTANDGGGVHSLDLGIGVELIEVAHTQSQVGICKELDGLGLLELHEQGGNTLISYWLLAISVANGAFDEKGGEGAGGLFEVVAGNLLDGFVGLVLLGELHHLGIAHNDAGRIEVVVQCLALAQELGREQEAELAGGIVATLTEQAGILDIQTAAITHRNGALDNNRCLGTTLKNLVDDCLHGRGVEEVLLTIVVGGGGDDDKIGITIGRLGIERSYKVEFFFCKVLLDVLVLNGRHTTIDHIDLLGDDINSHNLMVLG